MWDSLQYTTEEDKEEIVCSVSLCPPGPHALLLAIPVEKYLFCETVRRSVQEHLELLSERVWRHTIVLFTGGDRLGDTTIEQHIEREQEGLQWLVEKCGNRYHVLNNSNRGDGTQVTELLDKIEEMVAQNRGGHYDIKKVLWEVEEERRALEEIRTQMLMELQKQRETPRELPTGEGGQTASPETQRLSELRIVLLGRREAGKSSSGNTILGREAFQTGDLTETVTEQSEKSQGEVAGRQVTVVDTPGWEIWYSPECVKQEIVRSVSLCPPGPHALLLLIPVWRSSLTERERRSVQEHLELLSERVWRHTIVLFTWGDGLRDTTNEQLIERRGEELQRLVEKCGNRYHVLNNSKRGDGTQVTELLDKIEQMVAQNRGDVFVSEKSLQKVKRRERRLKELKQRMEEEGSRRDEKLEEKMRKTLKEEELEKETE
ncbi:GTPase IMAP family member 4-like [Amia ocellicauda]|uniref:GTPase IMAP family member 4-like n=1 Tax=Amia ocellicauda TaxID=2972642 RepID=UPI0034644819